MQTEEIVAKVKQVREFLDALIKAVQKVPGSRQMSIVKTKLQEARMWSGELLGELGEKNPYITGREGHNRTSQEIPTSTDRTMDELEFPNLENTVDCIDHIRKWIEEAVQMMVNIGDVAYQRRAGVVPKLDLYGISGVATTRLMEARMWAGDELGQLRG